MDLSDGEIYRPKHLSRVTGSVKKVQISGGSLGHFYTVLQYHFVGCNHPGETKPIIFKVNTVRDQKSILPWPQPLYISAWTVVTQTAIFSLDRLQSF